MHSSKSCVFCCHCVLYMRQIHRHHADSLEAGKYIQQVMRNNSPDQLQLDANSPCMAAGQQFWKDVCVDWSLTKLRMLRPKRKLTS